MMSMIVGALLGVIGLLLAYGVTMWLYIEARKRFSHVKFAVEAVTIALVLVFSIGVKFAIFVATEQYESLSGGVASLLHAVYSGIGGLGFEGLQSLSEVGSGVLQVLYTGSSVYAAFISLSVITAKASYEIFSYVRLLALRMGIRTNSKVDVYLFANVTEDSVRLAKSIVCHYEEKYIFARRRSRVRPVVIFYGEEIGAFDRSNPLHRDIMAGGFIYWSFLPNEGNNTAVLHRLGLAIDNNYLGRDAYVLDSIPADAGGYRSKGYAKRMRKLCASAVAHVLTSEDEWTTLQNDMEKHNGEQDSEAHCAVYSAQLNALYRYLDCLFDENAEDAKELVRIRAVEGVLTDKQRARYEYLWRKFEKLALPYRRTLDVMWDIADDDAHSHPYRLEITLRGQTGWAFRLVDNHCRSPYGKICVFAMGVDGNKADESKNSAMVATEMQNLIRPVVKAGSTRQEAQDAVCALTAKRNLLPVVDFYVLTGEDTNYEFYQDICDDYCQRFSRSDVIAIPSRLSAHFQIHVINEACITAEHLSEQRIDAYRENEFRTDDAFVSNNKPDAAGEYRVLVLGFGKTGQRAMETLYHDTAYVDNAGVPSQFIADVYDDNATQSAGLYAMTHPLFLCADCSEQEDAFGAVEVSNPQVQQGQKSIDLQFAKRFVCDKPLITPEQLADELKQVHKGMKLPVVGFHNASCFDPAFMRCLDRLTGTHKAGERIPMYRGIVVALGDDEANIAMANALLNDIKRECMYRSAQRESFGQTLYVHIRNVQNNARVNFSKIDEGRFPDLKVVLFGDAEHIYSYHQIIENEIDMMYNSKYVKVSGDRGQELMRFVLAMQDVAGASAALESIADEIDAEPYRFISAMRSWATDVTLFGEASNRAASRFGVYLAHLFKQEGIGGELERFSRMEHCRWNRFHIANGWTFAPYKSFAPSGHVDAGDKMRRRRVRTHDMLCPYDMVPEGAKIYDFVNVALGYINTFGE